jgi:hypothetical protein
MAQEPSTISSVEDIRQQIAHTRADMSRTIDAIQDRLRPSQLMSRTKDTVKDATVGRVKKLAEDNNTGFYALIGMAAMVLIVAAVKRSRHRRQQNVRSMGSVRAGLD